MSLETLEHKVIAFQPRTQGAAREPNWRSLSLAPPISLTHRLKGNTTGSIKPSLHAAPVADSIAELCKEHHLKTETEVAAIQKQASAEGYARGKSEAETKQQAYLKAVDELSKLRTHILETSEHDLLQLSLHISREVLAAEREVAHDFTERMVQHALKLLKDADRIVLRVGSADIAAIKEKFPGLFHENAAIKVIEDPSIELGGTVAESNLGRIDATLERRLHDATEQLLGTSQPVHHDDVTKVES